MNEAVPAQVESKKMIEATVDNFRSALEDLMERTDYNQDILNSTTAFAEALNNRANFGDSTKELNPEEVEKLTHILREAAVKTQFEAVGIDADKDSQLVKSWTMKFGF